MKKPLLNTKRKVLKVATMVALGALGLAACGEASGSDASGDAETFTFTLATGALEGTPHSAIEQRYLDMVEEATDGRVEFERTSFEAVCDMDEVVNCLRDGRADIGTTVTDYTPHLLPSLGVVGIPFLNTDMQAATSSMYDMHTQYEPTVKRLEDNNLHFVATWPSSSMFIGSKEPVENMEDLQGLRARAAGPVTQSILESAGVNVNAITAAETYESLQRGVIDSVGASLDFGVTYRITEQLPYWTEPGIGQYTAYGMWWNKAAFESLPDDLQQIVTEVTEELNYGEAIETFNEATRTVCDGMLESPHVESFTRWDEETTTEWSDAVGGDAENLWLQIVADYGFGEAEEFLTEYKATYDAYAKEDNPQEATLTCVDEWQQQNG